MAVKIVTKQFSWASVPRAVSIAASIVLFVGLFLPTIPALNIVSRRPVVQPVILRQRKPFTRFEDGFLRICAAGWVALCPLSIVHAKETIHNVFGLATETFQDNLREPAAGFLEITSALFPLEGALLLFLASTSTSTSILAVDSKVEISAKDWSRIGAALTGVSTGTISALLLAAASSEFQVTDPTLLGSFVLLTVLTGAIGLRASKDVKNPIALYKADALELLKTNGTSSPTAFFLPLLCVHWTLGRCILCIFAHITHCLV